jgi:hypothetical protein
MEIGATKSFVLAQGFHKVRDHWSLVGHDGSLRLLAQLTADPDHPAVRPTEAYQAMLASMQPGWVVRWLQIFWPDPVPRQRFSEQVQHWPEPSGEGEGSELLRQGLFLFLQEIPLPYIRRTVLEFCLPGGAGEALPFHAGQAWWKGLPGLLEPFGILVEPLSREEVQELANQIFNPELG